MRKNILTLLVIFLCFTAAAIGDEKKRVAVMDFRNEANIQGREINYITDLVRGAARRALPANLYIVMTKENIIEMLPPGKRLVDCTGAQCIVEAGRIVGADYVVDGEVVNFSGELRLSLSIYDTHDGNLLDTRRAGAKKLLDLEKPVMQAGSQLFSFLPGAKRESQPHNDGGERPSPENSVVVPPPPPDPEFENRVQEEQAKIEAQRRLEAQRKAKLDSDFAQAKAYHDNAGYSDDAKKAAYRYFLEKWPGDPTYGPQVEQWLKFGDAPEGMVPIPAGSFMMGCVPGDSECEDDEKPQHRVTVNSFYMEKYEVTQAQYEKVMVTNPSHFKDCGANCPVESVSWNDAKAYCEKVGQRLPTEAEWEYAVRGGKDGEKFYSEVGRIAWYSSNSGSKTHPVGQMLVNGYGLYDMTGNVWEWCSDWYDKKYYSSNPTNNPQGPGSGKYRVLRGGGWSYTTGSLRASYRDRLTPANGLNDGGFRCVRDK